MRIVCENLSFSYEGKKKNAALALNNVNLTVEEGEFFGIIGHTGSGKSTLIQHFNALIPLQSGTLTVGEFNLDPKNKGYKKSLLQLRQKVGMVFQYPEYQLFAESVYADVAFGLKNFRKEITDEQTAYEVKKALEAVGIDYNQIKDKSPFELSGGQRRRVAIAGVLVTNPEIMVLDEPVAGLDPVGKKELMALLHSLNAGGRTIIVVSHDMDEVCDNCDRVAFMENGRVEKVGTCEEIFAGNTGRMTLPLTAKIKNALSEKGVKLNCSLKTDDFIEAVIAEAKSKGLAE